MPVMQCATGASRPDESDFGWAMAYFAAAAVDRTAQLDERISTFPVIMDNGAVAAVEYRW